MKGFIGAILLVTIAAQAFAAKRLALLVGVNGYSFDAAASRLQGAGNDVGYIALLTNYCGFKSTTLTEANAKRAAILQALNAMADQASTGDQVLFYFTGRGSVDAKKPGGTGLSPTIAPFDAASANSSNDIAMTALEAWAGKVAAKGATPIVILDAAYSVSGGPAKRENRFYQYKPKAVVRTGAPRADVWKGPGICLSATDTTGNAFEWRVDPVQDKWRSAFTDLLVGRALSQMKKGSTPSYADLVTFLQSYWRKDPSYMPKTRPAPASPGDAYKVALFAMTPGEAPPQPTTEVQQQVQTAVQNFESKRRVLRLAIDADEDVQDEATRNALVAKYSQPITDWVKANLDGIEVIPTAGDQKDRSLYLSEKNGRLQIRVVGDEITETDRVIGVGADPATAFQAPIAKGTLAMYLQRQAYVGRIWNIVEMNNPTLDSAVTLVTAPSPTSPGQRMSYHVSSAVSTANLYLFDQDDSDGIVEMMYPASNRHEPTFDGDKIFPIQVAPGTPAGNTLVRALVVVLPDGVSLPSIVTSPDQFPAALLAHLKALVEGMADGSIKWRNADSKYKVIPR